MLTNGNHFEEQTCDLTDNSFENELATMSDNSLEQNSEKSTCSSTTEKLVGNCKCSLLMQLFKYCGSMQTLIVLSDLLTITNALTKSVGFSTLLITFSFSIFSNSFFNLSTNLKGTRLQGSILPDYPSFIFEILYFSYTFKNIFIFH